jgi:hypothetical protein
MRQRLRLHSQLVLKCSIPGSFFLYRALKACDQPAKNGIEHVYVPEQEFRGKKSPHGTGDSGNQETNVE